MKQLRILLAKIVPLVCFSCFSFAAELEVITVTGKGIAGSYNNAVGKALTEAIGKVNPTAISAFNQASKDSKSVSRSSQDSRSTEYTSSTEIKRFFSKATKGVVKSWDVVSETRNQRQEYVVVINAAVFRMKDSKQLNRKRISVVVSDSGDTELNQVLKETLEEALTKSRKFAVLQDNSAQEIQRFVNNIKVNGRIEDLARLQGTAAPEHIAVVGLGKLTDTGSRLRGKIFLEIIDYSSGQIKYQNSLPVLLKRGDLASAQRRLEAMGSELSKQLIAHIYPPLVVGWNGDMMTLGLGEGFFEVGDVIQVNESLGGMKDRYTGEFLEENLKQICKAVVRTVASRVALAEPREDCGTPFLSGSVDNVAELDSRLFVVTRIDYGVLDTSSSSSLSSKPKKNKSSDFDGLFKTD
jgi:hypothetical protein